MNEEFDKIVEDIEKLSQDKNLQKQLGPKDSIIFSKAVEMFKDLYDKAEDKGMSIQGYLKGLKGWAEEREGELKKPVYKKIGDIVSSYIKATGAWLSGDHKKAEIHTLNARQATQDLTQGKEVSKGLKTMKDNKKIWTKKVKEERVKAQDSQISR